MTLSLRTRLIAGLLALAAIGLLTLGAVTYAEQRSFLVNRIDQQARSALPGVSRALAADNVVDPSAPVGGRSPDGDAGGGGGRPGGGGRGFGGEGADANLPPGTYGELRDAGGKRLGHTVIGYSGLAAPKLPARLRTGHLQTVGTGKDDSALRYRVVSFPSFGGGGGTTVVAVPLREVDQTLNRLLIVEGLVIGAVLALLAAGAWLLVRIGLRPLDRIGEVAGAIAGGDLSRRVSPATERTEVGRLGLALNGMLGRIEVAFAERQASEERLRRFLSDASHELRTPLASIRGYAELLRTGAVSDPQDAARATARIEAEAARMGVLVEDLLTLARLDEERGAVRDPVDLARLACDAVDDARVVAPEREIEADVPARAVVLGDSHLLRQVLANLTRNAIVHTPAGTPIEVGVRQHGEQVELTVRDHGPGLPHADGDPFERFWRAEGGRERGRAGAGLGLSIVAQIVDVHGGSVAAQTADGGGALFTVRLPAQVAAQLSASSHG